MPKFSALTWVVIVIAQITYGLMVYAVTRSYYEQKPAVAVAASGNNGVTAPHPTPNPMGASITPGKLGLAPAAEDLSQDDPALIARLADNYFAEKNYQQAIDLYERAITINPDDVESYNDLGLALLYTGQSDQAVTVLMAGVQKNPQFQRIQLTLGFVLAQTGNKQGAADALNKAIELGADNSVGVEAKRMLGEL
ncbi:MAG: tetratricopeptide repeat protein [Candidatus Thiodiazotropha sp. 6PLUC2]